MAEHLGAIWEASGWLTGSCWKASGWLADIGWVAGQLAAGWLAGWLLAGWLAGCLGWLADHQKKQENLHVFKHFQ